MPIFIKTPFTRLLWPLLAASVLSACGSDGEGDRPAPAAAPVLSVPSAVSSGGTAGSASAGTSAGSSSSAAQVAFDFTDTLSGKKIRVDITPSKTSIAARETIGVTIRFLDAATGTVVPSLSSPKLESKCGDRAEVALTLGTTLSATQYSYTPKGCSGIDELTVSGGWGDVIYSKTTQVTVAQGDASVIEFVSAEPSRLDIAGTSGIKESTLTFRVKSVGGELLAGESIRFRLTAALPGARLVTNEEKTDSKGLVTVRLQSGSAPGVLTVEAESVEFPDTKVFSAGITVGTGIVVSDKFSLAATLFNPNSYNYAGFQKVSITAYLNDSSGTPVRDGTPVSFGTEYGSIANECKTSGNKGTCSVDWIPTGDSTKPLDGRVQIYAVVDAAEPFEDRDGNYLFTPGDVFDPDRHDIGDDFVDFNANGIFDGREFLIDNNGDRMLTLGDGKWTGPGCMPNEDPVTATMFCTSPAADTNNRNKTVKPVRTLTIYMARDDRPTLCDGADEGEDFDNSVKTVASGGFLTLSGLVLSDGNPYAENKPRPAPGVPFCDFGNPLPTGTKVSFSVDPGEIKSAKEFVIGNQYGSPEAKTYGVIYAAPKVTENTTAFLTMKITIASAGGEQLAKEFSYIWPINIIAPPAAALAP